MPDECCRKCGSNLKNPIKCSNCNFMLQEICNQCEQKTLPRFHECEKQSSFQL